MFLVNCIDVTTFLDVYQQFLLPKLKKCNQDNDFCGLLFDIGNWTNKSFYADCILVFRSVKITSIRWLNKYLEVQELWTLQCLQILWYWRVWHNFFDRNYGTLNILYIFSLILIGNASNRIYNNVPDINCMYLA